MIQHITMRFIVLLFVVLGISNSSIAQSNLAIVPKQLKKTGVAFRGDTLFYIYANLGPYTVTERAQAIQTRLEQIADKPTFSRDSFYINETDNGYDVRYEERIVMTITKEDAFAAGLTKEKAAHEYIAVIKNELSTKKTRLNWTSILLRTLMLIAALALVLLFYWLIGKGRKWLNNKLLNKKYNSISIKSYELISPDRIEGVIKLLLKISHVAIVAILIYLALPSILGIFPATKGLSVKLFSYVLTPLRSIGTGIVNFIPNAISIVLIYLAFRYALRLLKFFINEIELGKLVLPGFYADWARPTYQIVRIIMYAFMFIMIFPYLPGSDSPVFQGVSVFLGLLISLGSSSAISNMIAGMVITYMRPFRIGDRVKIGDTVGDVLSKTILVTRVRTPKNEEITIPNANILNGHTINYTTATEHQGLILHTTVTIGYDVPWKKTEQLLVDAAKQTTGIIEQPEPFVLQTSLDDFYVSYQLNAYTMEPAKAANIYSALHQNIQNGFNEAGVEILSPHYRAPRDGNMSTIPQEYLPEDYKAPSFNVNINKQTDNE